MNWKDVGNFVKDAAPKIGGLLTNPVGTVIEIGVDALTGKLGTDRNPQAVMEKLQNDPDALARVREAELDLEKLKVQADMNRDTQAAENIRTEATSEDEYVRRTRPKILRDSFATLAILTIGGLTGLVIMSVSGVSQTTITLVSSYLTESIKYFAGLVLAGFLGYAHYRSKDKMVKRGIEPMTVISGLSKIIRGK
jgi:hypothetical protein